jgi:ATP-dependent helicase/nuclease subunit B
VILKAPRNATGEEIEKLRDRELRRDGMILRDPEVLEAMENGDKKYLPVKYTKDGDLKGDNLVSAEQVGRLSAHVSHMLRSAVAEILGGGIECIPYYKNTMDNACLYCQYRAICRFDEDTGDRPRFARKMKTDEVWDALEM